jgi:hypothetical protein
MVVNGDCGGQGVERERNEVQGVSRDTEVVLTIISRDSGANLYKPKLVTCCDNVIAVHHRTIMFSGNGTVNITGGTFIQENQKQSE